MLKLCWSYVEVITNLSNLQLRQNLINIAKNLRDWNAEPASCVLKRLCRCHWFVDVFQRLWRYLLERPCRYLFKRLCRFKGASSGTAASWLLRAAQPLNSCLNGDDPCRWLRWSCITSHTPICTKHNVQQTKTHTRTNKEITTKPNKNNKTNIN